MGALLDLRRAHRGRARGTTIVVALTVGILGGTALAAWAGARRTASTFAAYEHHVRLSDVAVNSPDVTRANAIARLPFVNTSASYLGLAAFPVVDGKTVTDFRYTGVFGSLDGRFFTRDLATVVHGRLPRADATTEVALSATVAKRLGVGIGDDVEYRFDDADFKTLGRAHFRVTGIVKLPPVVVDENDIIAGAVLPPAATKVHMPSAYYVWQGLQLDRGARDIPALLDALRKPPLNTYPPVIQRYDQTRIQAQRSIRPQAVALALFGLAAAIAALALGGLGMSRLARRWSGEQLALRALGMTRRQRALLFGSDAFVAIVAGMVLAALLTIAVSPLWPLGSIHVIAPDTGVRADPTVLLGAGGLLLLALLAVAAGSAWRASGDRGRYAERARPSKVVAVASRSAVPVPAVLGAHFALDRGRSAQSVPVRATLFAGAAATAAVVAAIVFGASLNALVTHPAQYGWNWDRMMIAEAGFGSLPQATMTRLVAHEPAVTAWSLVAFNSVSIHGEAVPVLALDRRAGDVEPPGLSGHGVTSDEDIAFGRKTLEHFGLHVGDDVRVSAGGHRADLHVVGTVILPSIGIGGGDHTSLGRGAVLSYRTMANLVAPGQACLQTADALCPQVMLFDVEHKSEGTSVVRRISSADPDGTPGGTYEQPVSRAADIRNYDEMGSLPVALAVLLAAAASIAFLVTLVASVRARRRDLAILRTIGLTDRGIRAAVITQTLLTVFVTLVIGIPVGILIGRVTWIAYAGDIGVSTRPTIPVLLVAAIAAVAAVACGLFALVPTALATRTSTAQVLRSE